MKIFACILAGAAATTAVGLIAEPPTEVKLSMFDELRARTAVPRSAYLASSGADLAKTLNRHLQADEGLNTAPCHTFDLDELADLAKTLISMRHEALDDIYASVSDTRALRARDADALDSLWAQGKRLATEKPHHLNMVRAGKCAEVVMLYEHHLPEPTRDELKALGFVLPLLADGKYAPLPGETDGEVHKAYGTYTAETSCFTCHVQSSSASESTFTWPAEANWTANGYGYVPFWCSSLGDCHDSSYYSNPIPGKAKGWYSDSGGWEIIWHESCDVTDWDASWPSDSQCSEYWDTDGTVYMHFPDDDFCCIGYSTEAESNLGAMPRVTRYWPDLCTSAGTEEYSGDFYNGTANKFTMDAGGIKFFYYALDDGTPIAQGEGKTYDKDDNWNYGIPFPLYHEYEAFQETTFPSDYFQVPDVCASTINWCPNP